MNTESSGTVRIDVGDGWYIDGTHVHSPQQGVALSRQVAAGWKLTIRLKAGRRTAVMSYLELRPGDTTQLLGIDGELRLPFHVRSDGELQWAKVNPESERQSALRALLRHLERDTSSSHGMTIGAFAQMLGFSTDNVQPRRRGRPPRNVEHAELDLSIISAAYASAGGQTRSRQQHVRELLQMLDADSRPPLPAGDLRGTFVRARRAGLLGEASTGKAAGELTAKARRILAEHDFHADWYRGGSR